MYNHDAQEIKLAKHPKIQERWEPEVGDYVLNTSLRFGGISILDDESLDFACTTRKRSIRKAWLANHYWLPVQWQAERMCMENEALREHYQIEDLSGLYDWVSLQLGEGAPTTLTAMLKMVIELEESHAPKTHEGKETDAQSNVGTNDHAS